MGRRGRFAIYGLYDVLRVQLRFNKVTCILHTCRACANCAVRVVVLVPPNRGSPPAHAALSTAQGGGEGKPLAHVHRRPPSPEGGQRETVHAEGGPQRSPDIGVSARMGPATVCAPSLRTSRAQNPNSDARARTDQDGSKGVWGGALRRDHAPHPDLTAQCSGCWLAITMPQRKVCGPCVCRGLGCPPCAAVGQ